MRTMCLGLACAAIASCAGQEAEPRREVPQRLADAQAYAQIPVATLEGVTSPCEDPVDCTTVPSGLAATDSSGRIAFLGLSGRTQQVYLIEPNDRAPKPRGRVGSGPAEYRGVHRMGLTKSGDLVLFDLLFRRFVRFASSGRDTATAQLPMTPTYLDAGVVDGNVLLLATDPVHRSGDSAGVVLYLLEPGTTKPTEIARLRLRQPSWRLEDMRPMPSALDPRALWAFAPDGSVLYSAGDKFTISRFGTDGEETLRFGFAIDPRAAGAADLADASASATRGVTDPVMRAAASAQSGSAASKSVPAISALIAASDGSTWIREWPRASLDSVAWIRFDAAGAPVLRVVLGAHDALRDSNGDQLLLTQAGGARDPDLLRRAQLRPPGMP